MLVTNASLEDLQEWFYDPENPFKWMCFLLPSLDDHYIFLEMMDEVKRLDRATTENVAFMTFFPANDMEFGLNNLNKDPEVPLLQIKGGHGIKLFCTYLHNVQVKFKEKIDDFNDVLSDCSIATGDKIRNKFDLKKTSSYLILFAEKNEKNDNHFKIIELKKANSKEVMKLSKLIDIFKYLWQNLEDINYLLESIKYLEYKIRYINKGFILLNPEEIDNELKILHNKFLLQVNDVIRKHGFDEVIEFDSSNMWQYIPYRGGWIHLKEHSIVLTGKEKKLFYEMISDYRREDKSLKDRKENYHEICHLIEMYNSYKIKLEQYTDSIEKSVNKQYQEEIVKSIWNWFETLALKYLSFKV